MDTAQERILFRLVPKFGVLSKADFVARYNEEVGELNKEEVVETFSWVLAGYGKSEVSVFRGGLVKLVAANGKHSLFETEARCEERDRLNAWAGFARGAWVKKVPEEEGYYPVRSLDGRLGWRELRRVGGRLLDMTCYVPAGKTTTWAGDWWTDKVPTFPGAR
jgi:hypothetical protein